MPVSWFSNYELLLSCDPLIENLFHFPSQKTKKKYNWLALILELQFKIFQLHLEVFSFLLIFDNHVGEGGKEKYWTN